MYYQVRKNNDIWRFKSWKDTTYFLANVLNWDLIEITRHIENCDTSFVLSRNHYKKSYTFRTLCTRTRIRAENALKRSCASGTITDICATDLTEV